MKYDSAADTLSHINRVGDLLADVIRIIARRIAAHDHSKLLEPEKSVFDDATPRLRGLTYGSDEYKSALADIQEALSHHYAHNSHHPEYHFNGIMGMTLFDVIEMLCDWKAATERHEDGDLYKSLTINKARFKIDDQMASVLFNTAMALWPSEAAAQAGA